MRRRELIGVGLGREPADQIVRNARLVNVSTGEIYDAELALKGDRIAAVGDVTYAVGPRTVTVDVEGRFVTPGLVDGHLHSYHSYLGVREFVEAMLTHGITATTDGFYGQGIVGGMSAIRFLKESFDRMPIRLLFLVPCAAYLQNRELGLTPTPGISVEDMFEMLDWAECLGLEEPPYLPIVEEYPEFLDLLEATVERRKVVTGHAAGIDERQLQAYVAMGTYTDHESTEHLDAVMKARAGMRLLARHGTGCFDLPELMRIVTEDRIDPRTLAFCTDVLSPEHLMERGGLDEAVRAAVRAGVSPINAIQMATLNVAEIFRVEQEIGVLAPGRFADMLVVEDLASFAIQRVIFGGDVVVEDGRFVGELPPIEYPKSFYGTIRLPKDIQPSDLMVDGGSVDEDEIEVRVINVHDGSLVTTETRSRLPVKEGVAQPDTSDDVLAIAMIDRHEKETGIAVGFVHGFGLRKGALASSVNAVCENVLVVGTNYEDMALAANHLKKIDGGKVVTQDGTVVAAVELPLLGLLAEDPLAEVLEKFDRVFEAIREMGCSLQNPFSQLEFCGACGEIGDLKISEEGLVTVHPPKLLEPVVR